MVIKLYNKYTFEKTCKTTISQTLYLNLSRGFRGILQKMYFGKVKIIFNCAKTTSQMPVFLAYISNSSVQFVFKRFKENIARDKLKLYKTK